MKKKFLIIGLVLFIFGISNLLYVFSFYLICCDQIIFLLIPFGGNSSGNIPDPLWNFLINNENLEPVANRLGVSITFGGFNTGWPFSLWELLWSLSFYSGIILLTLRFSEKLKKNKI